MQLYEVGGAVRDRLLGEPSQDRDWVAVGATPQMLLDLGYKPVGRDFPVFLHPKTNEEVALARTERKSAPGYHGFTFHAAPEVTLEQDLERRDLTINAMALDAQGRLIDPFGGQRDLQAGVLRHVSPAFAEDPVRLLRVARFAARWPHFVVAEETQALLEQLVHSGEVDALVSERVWQELSRGLMATQPSRMVQVLQACGAWQRLLPELPLLSPQAHVLDAAAQAHHPLPVRYACLGWHEAALATPQQVALRLRVPSPCAELACLWQRQCTALRSIQALAAMGQKGPVQAPAQPIMALLNSADAWRRPERMTQLVQTHAAHNTGSTAAEQAAGQRAQAWVQAAWDAAAAVDGAQAVAHAQAQGLGGPALGQALGHARSQAATHALAAMAAQHD